MHKYCFELYKSERYDLNDPDHIKLMKRFNTKSVTKDELFRYLGIRATSNDKNINDEEIAALYSDPKTMILAADNATCDVINCFMTKVQIGEKYISRAN
jgi:hypothetical protein